MSNEEKHLYELISLGLEDTGCDKNEVMKQLISHLRIHEAEAQLIINGSYGMYPLYRDQALHLAREFGRLGIRTQIRKKLPETE